MAFWEPWCWSLLASVLPLSLRPMPPWVSSAGMCGSCTLLLASSLPKSFSISPCPVRCVVEGPASWRVICGWWEHHPGTTFISWPSPPALEAKLRVVSECFGHCFFLNLNSCVLDRPGFMKHFLFIHPYACIHLLMVVSSYVFIVFHFCCAGCIRKSGTHQISWFIISFPLKIATWGLEQSDFQTKVRSNWL